MQEARVDSWTQAVTVDLSAAEPGPGAAATQRCPPAWQECLPVRRNLARPRCEAAAAAPLPLPTPVPNHTHGTSLVGSSKAQIVEGEARLCSTLGAHGHTQAAGLNTLKHDERKPTLLVEWDSTRMRALSAVAFPTDMSATLYLLPSCTIECVMGLAPCKKGICRCEYG